MSVVIEAIIRPDVLDIPAVTQMRFRASLRALPDVLADDGGDPAKQYRTKLKWRCILLVHGVIS